MGIVFSQRLKEERKHCGLTQMQIAALLGIPISTYRKYEAVKKCRREPDIDMIVKIATILKTTTDFLMGIDSV